MDGAWWPRTRDIATELPALISVLTGHLGPITRVGVDASAWNGLPPRLVIDGQVMHLDPTRSVTTPPSSLSGRFRGPSRALRVPFTSTTSLSSCVANTLHNGPGTFTRRGRPFRPPHVRVQ
ncbi:DUF5994 family protein [Streptomyces sp. 147326]|uniref:DUF5994 family protein n=1 Tax=Streptomyces sp. 147326 TaxID=3074379 RepID=UPI00385770AE